MTGFDLFTNTTASVDLDFMHTSLSGGEVPLVPNRIRLTRTKQSTAAVPYRSENEVGEQAGSRVVSVSSAGTSLTTSSRFIDESAFPKEVSPSMLCLANWSAPLEAVYL